MDFPDDDDDDELLLSGLEAFEKQESLDEDVLDESVQFVGSQQEKGEEEGPPEKFKTALRANFGHSTFRPLQWKIIQSILVDKRDNCVIMTTGYGKSLCYQFPSVYANGVTLVISPLISLMEDQVLSLSVLNIKACLLGSAQTDKSNKIYDDIILGLYRVVYLTPEFVTGDLGQSMLYRLEGILTLVAIDEAHCVSSWGHDFRSAFRALSCIRKAVPKVPIMALTATATKSVLNDIVQVLRLRDPQKLCSGFDRPNLKFTVRSKVAVWPDLQRIIQGRQEGSIIIYCLKRNETENIVRELMSHGIECAAYHAGLSMNTRRNVHERFVKDQLRIIVATVAFGMGIDKPDVRMVINYGASREIEGYYQEIGRAGRDGQPGQVITFYNRSDFEFHAHMRETTKSAMHRSHMEMLNRKFQEYLETASCRRKFILQYFGDPNVENLQIRKDCCDNCDLLLASPERKIEYEELNDEGLCDFSKYARILMTAIDVAGPRYGVTVSILAIRGSNAKNIPKKLLNHPIKGTGSSKTELWWKSLYDLLERQEFLQKTVNRPPGASSYVKWTSVSLTQEGKKWMANGSKPLWLRPPREMIPYFKVKRKETHIPLDQLRKDPVQKLKILSDHLNGETRKLSYSEVLMRKLKAFRHEMALTADLMPWMLVSETCLQEMVQNPPRDLQQLSNYDGFSSARINTFGKRFIDFIKDTEKELEKEFPDYKTNYVASKSEAGPSSFKAAATTTEAPVFNRPTATLVSSEIKHDPVDNPNATFLDDDDDDELLKLEQAVLNAQYDLSPQEPPAKKKLLDIPSLTPTFKYDSGDSSDGDGIMASVASQPRVAPGWLTARPSQSSLSQRKSPKRICRNIKDVW